MFTDFIHWIFQKQLALTLVIVATITGCATSGIERVDSIKQNSSLVPLSLMGSTLPIRAIGTTVFHNERSSTEVPDWNIDRFTEETASRLIVNEKFSMKAAPKAHQAQDIKPKVGSIATASDWDGKIEVLKSYATDANADYIIIMLPALYGDAYFGTNQAFEGYGVYQRSFLGIENAVNYITMRIALVDGKTGEEIARTSGYTSARRSREDWMPFDRLTLSRENLAKTEKSIKQLVDDILKRLLTTLKLRDSK